jgi:hypothetical protein
LESFFGRLNGDIDVFLISFRDVYGFFLGRRIEEFKGLS